MGFGKVKRDKADEVFSHFIRLRDSACVRCGKPVLLNDSGLPVSGDASHYFGRGRESTRFDPENVDTLCKMSCHSRWEGEDRELYKAFKIKQLGQAGFDRLTLRANTPQKKDRKLAYLIWSQELKKLQDSRP